MRKATKALARRFPEEISNAKNLDVVYEWVAPTDVGHTATAPGGALKEAIGTNLATFPDLQIAMADQRREGYIVASRYTGRGTHRGGCHGSRPHGQNGAVYGQRDASKPWRTCC